MNIEKNKLEKIIKESKTYCEVIRKIGLPTGQYSFSKLQNKIIEHCIEDSHLVRKSDYTKEELLQTVIESKSIIDVCRKLHLNKFRRYYVSFDIKRWKIDISHFDRRAHLALTKDPFNRSKVPLDLVFQNTISLRTYQLKTRLFAEGYKKEECEKCGLKEYLELPIPLELNHINGNHYDNTLVNLEILCANCHSQTDTFAGRNKTWKFSDEQIMEAAKNTQNMTHFLKFLGYAANFQVASKRFKQKIKELNIDISHWTNMKHPFKVYNPYPFKAYNPWNKQSLKKLLQYGSKIKSSVLLRRLIKENVKIGRCEICLIKDWNGKELSFSLDHVNGDNKDNRLENLRILCFICHAFTPTYKGKNIKKYNTH